MPKVPSTRTGITNGHDHFLLSDGSAAPGGKDFHTHGAGSASATAPGGMDGHTHQKTGEQILGPSPIPRATPERPQDGTDVTSEGRAGAAAFTHEPPAVGGAPSRGGAEGEQAQRTQASGRPTGFTSAPPPAASAQGAGGAEGETARGSQSGSRPTGFSLPARGGDAGDGSGQGSPAVEVSQEVPPPAAPLNTPDEPSTR